MYITAIKYFAPVVLIVGYTWAVHNHGVNGERERWETKAYQATIKAHEAASKFTAGVLSAHKETEQDAQTKIDQLEAQLTAADAAYDSLHDSAKAYAKRAADSSRAAANCKATEDANRVLGNLLQQSDSLAGVYAKHADESRIAGISCERSYDSLVERINKTCSIR